jgi:hypothetical protein
MIVTLVHGTFAPDAAWTRSDSALVQALEVLGDGLIVRQFRWTGSNSHEARLAASRRLANHLNSLSLDEPDLLQFVIAHSHGGNVAMYATRELAPTVKLGGIICLGTPFIVATPRRVASTTKALSLLIWVLIINLMLLVLATRLERFLYIRAPETNNEIVLAWGVILGVLLFFVWTGKRLTSWVRTRLVNKLVEHQQSLIRTISLPTLENAALSIVRVVRDEAAIFLRIVDFIANLPYLVWRPTAILWPTICAITLNGILMLPLTIMQFEQVAFETRDSVSLPLVLSLVFLWPFIFLAIALGIFQLVLMAWPKIFRGHALGFGERHVFENWLVRISANRLPEGCDPNIETVFSVSTSGLRHSAIYNDPSVIRHVVGWLRTNLATTAGSRVAAN